MGKLRWYFAPCAPSLEPILAREVEAAGGVRIREDRGGVSFQGTRRVGYHLALWSRVAVRVLEELARARVDSNDDLYEMARRVRWAGVIAPGQTFAVFSAVSGHRIRHSRFAALRVKDGVVDQLREQTGARPDVDREDPDVPLKISVRGRVATLSRDLAGESLHRRGWRPVQVKSPLNEALAAGLLQLTGWDRASPLVDPMCGSATFLVEAAHLAGDRAPGLRRRFALQRWIDFDASMWSELMSDAEARWEAGRARIPALVGNDHHEGAVGIARSSCDRAEVGAHVELRIGDVEELRVAPWPGLVVVNPPYGQRLDDVDVADTWYRLGAWLKGLDGGTAWVLSGDPSLTRNLRLKTSRRVPILNGGLDCRWLRYELRHQEVL